MTTNTMKYVNFRVLLHTFKMLTLHKDKRHTTKRNIPERSPIGKRFKHEEAFAAGGKDKRGADTIDKAQGVGSVEARRIALRYRAELKAGQRMLQGYNGIRLNSE